MPIQKIFKGSDLLLELNLADEYGNAIRIRDTIEFRISLYTNKKFGSFAVIGRYNEGIFQNIIEQEDKDYLVIQSYQLDDIESGIFLFDYYLKVENSLFPSGYYSESRNGQTNLYLKNSYEI